MSNKKDKLLQRVAFRLLDEKHEKINSILDDGTYSSQSNFLRDAVDLLLFWENKITINEIIDRDLRKKILERFAKDKSISETLSKTMSDFIGI